MEVSIGGGRGGRQVPNRRISTSTLTLESAGLATTYWFPLGIGAGVAALLSAGLFIAVRRHWEISPPASLAGLAFAAAYVRIARTVPWKWTILAVMAASAVAIAALPEDLLAAMANNTSLTSAVPPEVVGAFWLTFVVYGLVLMTSGGISLWLYLRHTQTPEQEGR